MRLKSGLNAEGAASAVVAAVAVAAAVAAAAAVAVAVVAVAAAVAAEIVATVGELTLAPRAPDAHLGHASGVRGLVPETRDNGGMRHEPQGDAYARGG
jgi:hypothetical protein